MGAIRQLIVLFILLALCAGGAWLYMNDINPLDWGAVKDEWAKTQGKVDDISRIIENPNAPDKTETKVYKRKDADGNWYYTNEPPKEGEEAEEQVYRSDTNLMPLPEKLQDKNKK